jgi:membrane-bound lytic murein transglycosylase D
MGVFLTPRTFSRVLIVILPVLAACRSAVPQEMVKVAPPPPPVIQQKHIEPIVAPVPAEVPLETRVDSVSLSIVEAQLRFEKGEDLYRQGFLNRAKEEFDRAVDTLLDAASIHPRESRLDREIADLVGKIHALELLAIREGDGFTDQIEEHAAIDDLRNIETFPAPIDPKLKQEVEDEISELAHDLPIEINDRVLTFLS